MQIESGILCKEAGREEYLVKKVSFYLRTKVLFSLEISICMYTIHLMISCCFFTT